MNYHLIREFSMKQFLMALFLMPLLTTFSVKSMLGEDDSSYPRPETRQTRTSDHQKPSIFDELYESPRSGINFDEDNSPNFRQILHKVDLKVKTLRQRSRSKGSLDLPEEKN